jgi:hypothetical protein
MTQGSRNNTSRVNQIINLDEDLIEKRLAKPQKVFLAGKEWTVRRDLTAEEIYRFWGFVNDSNAGEAWALLMGITVDEAKELDKTLLQLPIKMYNRRVNQENTALLLETLTAQIEWAWADRTIDPEDPEVKRERAKAKANGVKPPKHPILRPVAKRPPDHDEQRWRDYIRTLSEFVPQPKDPFEQLEIWKRQNGVTASPER